MPAPGRPVPPRHRVRQDRPTGRRGEQLDAWIAQASQPATRPDLRSFITGLKRVALGLSLNGLTLPYSSGPVEGNVNRIKMMSSSRGRFSPRLSQNRT